MLDMECFRIDESGYTGFDLLNPDQRFQGAAAIAISDQGSARLISEHFPKLQAPELKCRALSRRPTNHPRLLSLQRDLLTHYKCVTYVCDKRFLLLLMFVDYAVEPFYYEKGINFYEDGQNYAMASLLSVAGPTLFGQPAFDTLLASFQHAVKEKTPEALNALLSAARATKWRKLPEALGATGPVRGARMSVRYREHRCGFGGATIPDQPHGSNGRRPLSGRARSIQEPAHLPRSAATIHRSRPENRVSQTIKFSLKLAEVRQVDLKASPAVQSADVMIGAAGMLVA
jgi:hypothetical protein